MQKSLLVPIIIYFSTLVSVASYGANETLNRISKKYQSAGIVDMAVEKVVRLELQGRETNYKGHIFLAKGKFRWENTTPEETLLIFDGKNIWSVNKLPKELGGTLQIARGRVDKKNRSQILISSLLSGDVNRNFKVETETILNGVNRVHLKPLKSDIQVSNLNIVIDSKSELLSEISFNDDLGNQTIMKFSDVKFSKKADNKKFNYQPPSGAQVTDL